MIIACFKHLLGPALCASMAFAGTTPNAKNPALPPPAPAVDLWEFTLTPYGWLAGLEGTTGIKGFTAETEVPFKDILDNLDMVAALNLEARRGRWGGWLDGLYLKISDGAPPDGPLLDSFSVDIEQVVAEAAVFYRVIEGKRGYLDLYAGARYMSVNGELTLNINEAGVAQLSRSLSSAVIDRVVDEVTSAATGKAANKKAALTQEITDRVAAGLAGAAAKVDDRKAVAGGRRTDIATTVFNKGRDARSELENLQVIAAADPKVAALIRRNASIQSAIRRAVVAGVAEKEAEVRLEEKVAMAELDVNTVQAKVAATEEQIAAARAALAKARGELQSAKASLRNRAQSAVNKAEKKLASAIDQALRDAIPEQVSDTVSWVDPFVGARACYHLSDRWYAISKADIGGFGISSDLVWQVYGGLGCHVSKNTRLELGYKYMSVDYTTGGFTFDVAMRGAFLSLAYRF